MSSSTHFAPRHQVASLDLRWWRTGCSLADVVTGQTVGAGHFSMLEVPDQVNSMIEHFIKN